MPTAPLCALSGEIQPGETQPGETQPGETQLGEIQIGEDPSGELAGYDRATITVLRWDPSRPHRVYAGTLGWGLVVSENGGHTWSATAPQLGGRTIQSIAVHPELDDVVFASTLRQGVWMSTDGGRNFQRVFSGLPEVDVPGVSVALDLPPDAATPAGASADGDADAPADAGSDSTSPTAEDGSAPPSPVIWAALRRRGPVVADRPVRTDDPDVVRMQPFFEISAHPHRPDDVLVAGRGMVARTRDGGATWEQVFNPRDGRFLESRHLVRGLPISDCASVPFRFLRWAHDPDHVWLAACWGLFSSRDGGASWEIEPLGGFGRVFDVAAHPRRPGSLAVSTDQGLLRSGDAGLNWEFLRAAAPGSPLRAVTVLPGGDVLAGGWGGEVVRANADGVVSVGRLRELQATRRTARDEAEARARRSTAPYDRAGLAARPEAKPTLRPGIDLHVADVAVHPILSNVLYAGTRRGVFRSDDGGNTWRHASLGLGELEVSDLVVDASSSLVSSDGPDPAGERLLLWAATRGGGIYRSTSGGAAWQPATRPPTDGVVRVLLQDRNNPYLLWAGTADAGVFRSDDAGDTWRASTSGLGAWGIRALVQSGGTLLAATDKGWLFESTDDGESWRPRGILQRRGADEERDLERFRALGLDPENLHIHDLLADPDDDDRLLAASSFGVFRSEDGGRSWDWTRLRRSVARLARDPYDDDKVYAATTRGLWWSDDGGESFEQADFGEALNDLALAGGDLDPTKALRETPPLFALAVAPWGDVLAGTDRGQVLRGSAEYGGWSVAHVARPAGVRLSDGHLAPRTAPDRTPTAAEREAYEAHRARRDQMLVAAALAPEEVRRLSRPRAQALLALEARRRGEVPVYPPEVLAALPPLVRAEVQKEDVATRVLRLADLALRSLGAELLEGWGVESVRFGPVGGVLAVQSAVDDGRSTRTEIRLYDLERRFLQPEKLFSSVGTTAYWKVLHDLARKPQAAQPDWLLEDTGPLLFWRRHEILVTRPRGDRLALWRLDHRGRDPAAANQLQPGTLRGFPLPVEAVSISEDGRWLGAVDRAGRAYVVHLAGDRKPTLVDVPMPEGAEAPVWQQIHATSQQLLLLGPSGIVAYRWGAEAPVLRTADGGDAGEELLGPGAGFSQVVADRQGRWMAALPASSDETAEDLVLVAFRDGRAVNVHSLVTGSGFESAWSATLSARQGWLAVRRAARDVSESFLFDLRGDLARSAPRLVFRIEGLANLRFGAGDGHVTFWADGEHQVWDLLGTAPLRVEEQAPRLDKLEQSFLDADPLRLAAWFFEGEPRMANLGEWAPHDRHPTHTVTSPDGRWLVVAGPGRLARLWHFDLPKGTLAGATGSLLLDLARFRAYPSTTPSSLDAWPELRRGAPGPGELWRDACEIAGRNLTAEEWLFFFGEESWAASCVFE